MIKAVLGVAFALSIAGGTVGPGAAQTLNMMKSIDAPHYDARRTTWGPTSDIVNMFQDTLVALDWDGTLTEADRARSYALMQQKAMQEHLWMPALNINMDEVANKKVKGARPHMIYQNTFYKGLDTNF